MTRRETTLGRSFFDRVVLLLATGLGVGWVGRAPGTVGTLWGLVIAWGLSTAGWSPIVQVAVLIVVCALGVAVCGRAAAVLGVKDPGVVVYDEFASLPLAFLFVTFSWPWAAIAFAVFRALDITKPWPIRRLERLPGGLGIMADDVAAGVLTGLIVWGAKSLWTAL